MKNNYKVTVIGAGDRGNAYMKALKEIGGFQYAAICDLIEERTERVANEYGFICQSNDYKDAIVKSLPDIVIVATPAYLHCDISKFAMEKGAHVITEKPFDLSLEKCFELKEVAVKTGKKLAMGLQYRNIAGCRAMKHMFERKLLGENVMLNFKDIRETRPKIAMHDAQKGNGGPIVDMSCHFLDLMSWYFNSKPERVYAKWLTYASERDSLESIDIKAPDTAIVTVEYESGDIGNITVCWGLPPRVNGEFNCWAVGNNGYMKTFCPNDQGRATVVLENMEEIAIGIPTAEEKDLKNPEATIIINLIKSIEGVGTTQSSFDEGIMGLAASMAAIKSSVLKRPVEINEILNEKPTVIECMGV